MYIGAYEASVQRSANKLCSVVNTGIDYRGGNNTHADWDETNKSLLGVCAVGLSVSNFRTYARNRNNADTRWNIYLYEDHKTICWLFAVEYATFNSQKDYLSESTSAGYKQGGLGSGPTTFYDHAQFNEGFPMIKCGTTDSFGNSSGSGEYEVKDDDGSTLIILKIPRYRGIELPFGHIWKFVDGIHVAINPSIENGGDGLSAFYTCNTPSMFNNSLTDAYVQIGNTPLGAGGSYISGIYFGENGDVVANNINGGSSNTYCCDFYYNVLTAGASQTIQAVLFGGGLNQYDKTAGLFCFRSDYGNTIISLQFGTRLCYIPN